MRNIIIVLFLFIFGLGANAQQHAVVPTQIKEVSVFLSMAQVNRQGNLYLGAGAAELIFDKLSPHLNEGSVEVKVPKGVHILSVSYKNDGKLKEEKPAEILSLEDSLLRVKNALYLVQTDKENINLQRELILANKSLGGTAGVKAEELEDVLSIYENKLNEFKFRKLKLDEEERLLIKQKDHLEVLLNDYNQGKINLSRQIRVQVMVDQPQQGSLVELKYSVNQVSWGASYDVRVSGVGAPVEFILKGNISQSTGEDWSNVKLKLAGIDPLAGGSMPILEPIFLRVMEPDVLDSKGPKRKMHEPEIVMGAMPAMMADNDQNYIPSIIQTPTALKFEVNVPYSIPSDGVAHQVELARFDLPASYKLMSTPKYDESVYVNAAFETNDLLNQLNAEANIYYDGSFTGTTYISSQTNDTMLITLGKERRMVIKRAKLKEMTSKSIFGSNKKEKSGYQIAIINTSTESLELELFDQIPISANGEIEVKLLNAGGATYNAENGQLQWKVKIAPKQEVKLQFEFEVSFPKAKRITPY
jgi:uncharacterized protein (TIGR02231 family)